MTTAANTNGWAPEGIGTAIPPVSLAPLQANESAGRGQYLTYNSAGDAALNGGATPGLIAAGVGYPAVISGSSSVAGSALENVWQGYGSGAPASTATNDGFTKADVCTPAWIADENHLGKLSNRAGSNRSLGGLVFGLDSKGNPRSFIGPAAQAIARSVLMTDAKAMGWIQIADAAASDAIAERAMTREKFHGTITAIQFTGAAIAADVTDYITVTISKRDGAGGAATVVGTYDSRAANNGAITAFVPAAFTLSVVAGALNLLETDILTIIVVKGGSGKVITGSVRVLGKVL